MVDLKRFVKGYMCYYDQAIAEIAAGEQKGHWIFMVFPQLRELGYSAEAKTYGIKDRAEAEEFMRDPQLAGYLTGACRALLDSGHTPEEIFGYPDELKIQACATLFRYVSPETRVFDDILSRFYKGQPDAKTLEILGR